MSSNRSDKRERNVDREKRKNDSRYGSAHFSPRAYKEMECLTLKRPSKATLEERFYKRVSRVSPELEGKIKFLDDENFNVTRYKPSHSRDEANNRSDRKGNKDFRRYYKDDLANIQEFDTGESMLESNNYKYDENRPFDKKRAFLMALKDSPKSARATLKGQETNEKAKSKISQEKINYSSLYVGNLFNSVENEDIERLLEPYGSITEVRRYEKHAIVNLNCSREKAEQATKDLDHNHWMDNWIRVKFDKFELSKEQSWKQKTKKVRPTGNSKYAHCDRDNKNEVVENEIPGNFENQITKVPAKKRKFKVIDLDSKRTLSKYLKSIRHDHCVEVVDTLVKAKEMGKLKMINEETSVPLIAGIQVTSKKQDPRQPIVYEDIDF